MKFSKGFWSTVKFNKRLGIMICRCCGLIKCDSGKIKIHYCGTGEWV